MPLGGHPSESRARLDYSVADSVVAIAGDVVYHDRYPVQAGFKPAPSEKREQIVPTVVYLDVQVSVSWVSCDTVPSSTTLPPSSTTILSQVLSTSPIR